jgi:hypothetical protein
LEITGILRSPPEAWNHKFNLIGVSLTKPWRAERVLADEGAVPWMTIEKALRETDDFLVNATGDEATLFGEVKDYLYDLAERLGSA